MNEAFLDSVVAYAQSTGPDTKIYIGSDSRRRRKDGGKFQITFTVCVVFHIDGSKGCKVFADMTKEIDYHGNMQVRLMTEAIKACEMYQALEERGIFYDHEFEVHLDLNPKKEHKSNTVMAQAVGYVRGVTGVDPKIKPEAWAASTASDLWELKYAA